VSRRQHAAPAPAAAPAAAAVLQMAYDRSKELKEEPLRLSSLVEFSGVDIMTT
jgi:hypothetical protein